MIRRRVVIVIASLCCLCCAIASASIVVFFDSSQLATPVESGVTWDTISSNGYLFTYTRDKLFTGGIGSEPLGRQVRIPWPEGVEAQAVTTPPPGVIDYKARINLQRVDGDVFDLNSFTATLLANTAGAGAAIEIMPLVDGEDAFEDPLNFDATGFYGSTFSYDETPNPWGSTAALKDFDTYRIGLYVDFAFTALTLEGAAVPGPPGDYSQNGIVDAADYTVWRDNLGQNVALPNEAATLGEVTQEDYDAWKQSFGQRAGMLATGERFSVAQMVPEPNTESLLLATAVLCFVVRPVSRLPPVARRPTAEGTTA